MKRKSFLSFFTRLWFTAKMAGHGILSKPLRTFLTILGVSIGVASVVSLMGIGEGARKAVVEQFESLGTNVIKIVAHDKSVEFKAEFADELVERVDGLNMVSPVTQTKAVMKWKRTRTNNEIIGVNEKFLEIRDHKMLTGHFFNKLHVNQRSSVAVLGYNVARTLLNGRDPVGRSISLNGQNYRIIGVLSQKGDGNADNIDDKIIIPYTSAQKISQKRTNEEIWGKAESKEYTDLVVVQLGRIFKRKLGSVNVRQSGSGNNENNGGDGSNPENPKPQPPSQPVIPISYEDLISITSLNKLVNEADNANRVMTLLLGGIASVSLLVGGLGIMNIMLVAVTERTEEIGVRRALGAKQTDLLLQFILEALYVSIIGTVVGIVLGLWGMKIFENYGFQTAVNLKSIKVSSVVALASGLLFGVYPAVSASSVPPVEALRRR